MAANHSRKQVAQSKRSRPEEREEEKEGGEGSEFLRKKHHFVRSTIRTDYQPDICKDYKETGFCGFGDSCKFLHDRSDYKHGWELDQEWARGEHKEEADDKYLIKDDQDQEGEEDLNRCSVCKEPYKSPVVTKCKHFFCMDCAEKECNSNCNTCQKPTSGIFKNASKLLKDKLAKRAGQ